MKRIRLAIGGVAAAGLLVFLIQNIETINVRFLFLDFSMPRAVLILVVFFVGAVIGWILSDVVRGRAKR